MEDRKRGGRARLRYAIDNLMSKGGASVFLALMSLFLAAIVLVAVLRFVANLVAPQEGLESLPTQWWLSFLQIADGGSIGEDTGSNAPNRIVGIVALFLGMVLFSSLVAFITSQFEAMIERLKRGKSPVVEKGHSLVLGFGDRCLEIVRELVVANESRRDAAVVVVSETDKTEMDDFFRERVGDARTTRIVTRSGSTSSMELLGKVGVVDARSVVILNDAEAGASREEKELADARVIKTILAVLSCTGEADLPPIVAEIHSPAKQALARSVSARIGIVDEHSVLAKLMVQTSRVSGLAQLYDSLVGFEGSEFYFHAPAGGLAGVPYGDLLFRYPEAAVMGRRRKDGRIEINPPAATRLAEGDEVLLIAEDDSRIRYSGELGPAKAPPAPRKASLPRRKERQLIIGWCRKTRSIIDEYAKYLLKGSAIHVAVFEPDKELRAEFEEARGAHPGLSLKLVDADLDDPLVVRKLAPETYDNVIILSPDGGEAELKDSETISKLLALRLHFKGLATAAATQLITEVSDSDNIDIIRETGVKDFLISNKFVSKIYAQVSEDPRMLEVYTELFGEEGSELYLKPAELYFALPSAPLSFAEICAAALGRGETCIGVRLAAEEASPGAGMRINPAKEERFVLGPGDQLMTLAENEA